MKDFIKRIHWKYFIILMSIITIVIGLIYGISLYFGLNTFPEQFFVVYTIPPVIGFGILFYGFMDYYGEKCSKEWNTQHIKEQGRN